MQNKLKTLFVMMMLAVILTSLASVEVNAAPPVGLFIETHRYSVSCCEALTEYVRCSNSDSSYEEALKSECSFLAKIYDSLSMDDFKGLAKRKCGYSESERRPDHMDLEKERVDEVKAENACLNGVGRAKDNSNKQEDQDNPEGNSSYY